MNLLESLVEMRERLPDDAKTVQAAIDEIRSLRAIVREASLRLRPAIAAGMEPEGAAATVYVVLHESVLASWAKDVVSVASLLALGYANHAWLGGSAVLDVMACVALASVGFASITGRRRVLKSELVAWAKREAGEQ